MHCIHVNGHGERLLDITEVAIVNQWKDQNISVQHLLALISMHACIERVTVDEICEQFQASDCST